MIALCSFGNRRHYWILNLYLTIKGFFAIFGAIPEQKIFCFCWKFQSVIIIIMPCHVLDIDMYPHHITSVYVSLVYTHSRIAPYRDPRYGVRIYKDILVVHILDNTESCIYLDIVPYTSVSFEKAVMHCDVFLCLSCRGN